jgi:hypothetical protein
MPFRFRIDTQHGVVFAVSEGSVGTADVRDYLKRLESDPAYRSGYDALIDVRHATSNITADDLRDIAELVRRRPREAESKRAVVVSSDEHYGLMRMFEAFTESGPTRYRVFRDLEEARAWVEGESDPE